MNLVNKYKRTNKKFVKYAFVQQNNLLPYKRGNCYVEKGRNIHSHSKK